MTFATPQIFRSALFALAGIAALQAAPAAATVHIITATANPVNATTGTFTIGTSVFNVGNLVFDPFDEFTVEEGDTIELTLTLAGAFTVPGSMEQLFAINFFRADGVDPLITATGPETTVSGSSIYSYSMGPTGLSSDTQGGACGNCLSAINGQIPGGPFTFDGIKLTQTIDKLGAPYTVDRASFSYQLRDVAGAIPEPATWAMMIMGFGLIGGALRQRKAATVRYAVA